jgi:hypothetical protein
MPLAAGIVDLESTLAAMFADVGGAKNPREFAHKKATAIHSFVKTGVPMTLIVTLPGAVAGAMTAGPVSGTGLGGIDKPSPGMGLNAAHPLLVSELTAIYTHGNAVTAAKISAQKISKAIMNYFSQAIVMTMDMTDSPVPAAPPAGPVSGTIKGNGGLEKPSPGAGYDSVVQKLEDQFFAIFSAVQDPGTIPAHASKIGDAIHAFCLEGKITTTGTILAPAVVATPPGPPVGSYSPGAGASISSTLT